MRMRPKIKCLCPRAGGLVDSLSEGVCCMSKAYPLTLNRELLESLMMLKRIAVSCLLYPSLCFLWISCTPTGPDSFIEVDSAEYQAAKQKMREGDVEAALELFHRVIDKYPYAPESHLETGVIYLRYEDEPVLAIYHFHRYLELNPDSREAPLVQELIVSAKKQFATSLPGNPFKDAVSRMELLETIAALKRQVETLNTEMLELQRTNTSLRERLSGTQDTMREILSSPATPAASSELSTTADGADTVETRELVVDSQTRQAAEQQLPQTDARDGIPESYEVRPGDSLYAISLRFYGSSDYIQAIFQANRSVLHSVNDLRPGQVLRLPDR